MDLDLLGKKELIEHLRAALANNEMLVKKAEELTKKVESLERQLSELKSKKDSGNSSLPPSQDPNRKTKCQGLRKKSGRGRGGQPGHKGHTLEMSGAPDEVVEHMPHYCQVCGEGLSPARPIMSGRRQVVDLPPIQPIYTDHIVFSKTCRCGNVAKGRFPSNVKAPVQYGPGVESLAGYLSVRQYLPYQRMKECFHDIFGLAICEGSLVSAVRRLSQKSLPVYQRIKENIGQGPVAGSDETGAKANGKNAWFWTWQNPFNTFIAVDPGRGYQAIERVFPQGLPGSVLVSDCLAAQLKTPAQAHQLCMAHLLRELNFFVQLYDSPWAKTLRQLFLEALKLKSEMDDYGQDCPIRNQLAGRLEQLLDFEIEKQPPKLKPFHKRLRKNRDYIFPFLFYEFVPPDNNASERAIRNVKVKQKISGQFINLDNAMDFAIVRSVIDTVIKNGQNILYALKLIAKLTPE